MDSPITQKRSVQFRGPSTSDSYNQRIEENYQDLVMLYNRMRLAEESSNESYSRFAKEELSLVQVISDLEQRIANLETARSRVIFSNAATIDTDRFKGTQFAIPDVNQLSQDIGHGVVTLPQVPTSSVSKLAFVEPITGMVTLPPTLATTILGVAGTGDDTNAVVDTSPPELAMARKVGRMWQRNIILPNPNNNGAQLFLYVAAPTDLFTTSNSNCLILHPFPAFGTDILEVAYTSNVTATMADTDGYTTFPPVHVNDMAGRGFIPPGSWTNGLDADFGAGYRAYYFDPVAVTGLRIKLGQRNYIIENGQYVYSYGASLIDLQYIKFLSSGSIIIRIDAVPGQTISQVSNVEPLIWNVLEAHMPDVFSWQGIWETSFNSGIYTNNPVADSRRVWLQLNLVTTLGGGTPALAGVKVTQS